MSKSEKQRLAAGGIQLNVFSTASGSGEATPQAAVLFLLHGRLAEADDLEAAATELVEKSEDRRRLTSDGAALRLVVVTFVSSTFVAEERNDLTDPVVRPGPEESWCENNQPSGEPTMEPQREGEQPSACGSALVSSADR